MAKHVTVRWSQNTAQDIGSEIGDWTVDEIERDGDRMALILDNEIIAEFGRYDADVFLVEDEDERLGDEDEDEPLEDEDEDEDEPLEDEDEDEDEPLEDEDEDEDEPLEDEDEDEDE